MPSYGIAEPKVLKRGSLEAGTRPVLTYVLEPSYGKHATVREAKLSYMVAMDPNWERNPVSAIRTFDAWRRNLSGARVVRWESVVEENKEQL